MDNQTDSPAYREGDYLPISMLNQIEYCERRFYLMHVLGEMEINVHVLEGSLRHEQAHSGQSERQGDKLIHRRAYVWSDVLGLVGFCDVVEERLADEQETGQGKNEIIPIEYKKGRMGRWISDHVQLCAQALCLEERLEATIPKGYLFYFGSRRRQEVLFTPELRQRTFEAITRARELIAQNQLPPPLSKIVKCRDCSLEPVCLPGEVRKLVKMGSV